MIVFLPCAGLSFPREFVQSYLQARTYFQHHPDMIGKFELVEDFPNYTPNMAANRNICAGKVIEGVYGFRPDISIWLDIDHQLPYDVLVRLLSNENPVVSGMYFGKNPPYYPIVYEKYKYDRGLKFWLYKSMFDYDQIDPFEADMVGMGCVRIDREVFLKLKPPYFRYQPHSLLENMKELEFLIRHGVENNTEEPKFWEQVREKGYKIIVDPKIQLGHIGKLIVNNEHWLYNKVKYVETEDKLLEDKVCTGILNPTDP